MSIESIRARLGSGEPNLDRYVLVIGAIFVLLFSYQGRKHRLKLDDGLHHGTVRYLDVHVTSEETVGFLLCKTNEYLPVKAVAPKVIDVPIYPLYGKHLNHRVAALSVEDGNLSDWVAQLRRRNVRFLAVGPVWGRGTSKALSWIESNPQLFSPIAGLDFQKEFVLYRIQPTTDASSTKVRPATDSTATAK